MRRLLVLVVLILAVAVVPALALPAGDSVIVNRAPDGTDEPATSGFDVSADGRCVAFVSAGDALPGSNDQLQVYLRDTVANTTELISATPAGVGGDGHAWAPDITPDCRYVAFHSQATNLTGTATPTGRFLTYRRDLESDTTVLVSRATGASGALPDSGAQSPTISDDGTRVVFASQATNLAADDNDGGGHTDLFLRRLDTNTTTLVTRDSDGVAQDGSGGAGFTSTLSGDGTRLAFSSAAQNLSTEDASGNIEDVFVKDLVSGVVTYVSRASGPNGEAGNAQSRGPEISGDGARVAFVSIAPNLSGGTEVQQVYVRDLNTNVTTLVSRGAGGEPGEGYSGGDDALQISADGDRVAFHSGTISSRRARRFLGAAPLNVFVADLSTGVVEVAARQLDGAPMASASFAAISAAGDYVAFITPEGLSAGDTDGQVDLYLHHFVPAGGPGPTPTATPTATAQPPAATPTPAPPGPPPAAQTIRGEQAFVRGTANDLYLACTTLDLYLVDVLPSGRKVAVTGAADLRLAGRTADILLDGRKVGTARIGAGGAFAAKVAAPARKRRARARYQAKVGSTASQKLRLVRRMVATTLTRSGGNLTLRGVVNAPRARKQPVIAVERFRSCKRREKVKVPKVRPGKGGRFAIRIKVPSGAEAVLYRARTKVPARAGRPATKGTFTLPRAADVG